MSLLWWPSNSATAVAVAWSDAPRCPKWTPTAIRECAPEVLAQLLEMKLPLP
jgi:hypothetical protein